MRFSIAIKNGLILTMDKENRVIQNGFLGISADKISYIGEEPEDFFSDEIIDANEGIVLPGLVNAHTHIPMSLLRGIAEDISLKQWLEEYIFPIEKKLNSELVYIGALLSCAEMIMSGTTTFCDMYFFEDEVAKAAKEAGMRCLISEGLFDFPSPNYGSNIEDGYRYTRWLIEKWKDDPLVNVAVGPHTPYTCSEEILRKSKEIAEEYNVPIIIHLAETKAEVQQIKERYGKTPTQYLNDLKLLSPHLIAAHCVHLSKKDMELIKENNVKVVHNPECNMKLASGISPVPEMLSMGICVSLGTDGSASNNNLDLFQEMDTAAKLHKISKMDPSVMDAITVVKMATIYGAEALGMEKSIGSLEVGKKADVIILDTNKPHLTPLYNPFYSIVYSAVGADVAYSIINGKVVMRKRELVTLDVERIIKDAKQWAAQIRAWLS
ncbi:MAG: S-adenosylhomocysteine deaminase [Deltaproteobacteria bacterium]|nr:MAG: S-adenosylhomocysteine deaminase [Deltaproteobacteria bacterium]